MAKSDPKQTDAGDGAAANQHTGWRASAWACFLAMIVVVLAADLGLKAWSFEHVADTPVRVQTAEAGGPEVLVKSPLTGEWTSAYELGLTSERRFVPRHEPVVVIPGLLNFQLTLNTGAVFGTGQGGRPFFITVSVIAIAVILVLLHRSKRGAWVYQAGLALILGGALGNLYDRAMFSAVRDMLHMLPNTGLWPWIFNPADVALVIGVGLVLVVNWVTDRSRVRAQKAEGKAGNASS